MTSLSNKPLFNQFLSSLLFFHLLLIVLHFVSSSTAPVSSLSSPFAHSSSKVKIEEETEEAMALLNWKTSLHNKSQSLLSSWVGTNPCNWIEINCDHSGSVTHDSSKPFKLWFERYALQSQLSIFPQSTQS